MTQDDRKVGWEDTDDIRPFGKMVMVRTDNALRFPSELLELLGFPQGTVLQPVMNLTRNELLLKVAPPEAQKDSGNGVQSE